MLRSCMPLPVYIGINVSIHLIICGGNIGREGIQNSIQINNQDYVLLTIDVLHHQRPIHYLYKMGMRGTVRLETEQVLHKYNLLQQILNVLHNPACKRN